MSSSADIFQQVRSAVDIVEIIGEHVALKRAGREFKGLCPFHDDHKPSMAVVPHKQIFHCFVCGTGGDVFKFVKEFHKLGNGEALRMLAQRAGIKLPELPRSNGRGGQQTDGPSIREQIAATNEWACTFFQKTLRSAEGKLGLAYLHSRGLTDETIEKFRLGFAPDSWTALTTAAMKSQNSAAAISSQHLFDAGLIKKRNDSSPYDAFRNRVIFPIIDSTGGASASGRVIAFGGRVLEEKRDDAGNVVEAKYLNSPESPLFNKSASLYGINHARQQIVRTRVAVVVEGYMDVIAAHQSGVTNVIATLGTALTPEHARALKNYAQTIVLLFDSDDAGFRAADRALEVFIRTPLDIKIASVPDGKDPCDYCMRSGGEAFQRLVDSAQDALTYKWNALTKVIQGSDSVTARQDAVLEFLRFTAASMESQGGMDNIDPIRRGQLIIKLSSVVGLSVEEVTQTLRRLTKLRISPPNTGGTESKQKKTVDIFPNAQMDAERWLIGFLMHLPALYDPIEENIVLKLFLVEEVKAALFLEYYANTPTADRSIVDFCSFVEEQEKTNPVIHAIIEYERQASRWEDLEGFSALIAKLIQNLRADRGITPEKVVQDCLDFLVDQLDERLHQEELTYSIGGDPDALAFKQIDRIKTRMLAGKTIRNVGVIGAGKSPKAEFEKTHTAVLASVG